MASDKPSTELYRGVTIYFEPTPKTHIFPDDVARRYRCTIKDRTYSAVTIGELKSLIDAAVVGT